MDKKLIASSMLPVVQKEVINGHIFTMQLRLFQKLSVEIWRGIVQMGNCYRCGNILSATLKTVTLFRFIQFIV